MIVGPMFLAGIILGMMPAGGMKGATLAMTMELLAVALAGRQ